MKHFVGGYALGFVTIFILWLTDKKDNSSAGDVVAVAFFFFAPLCGIAAWGLL